MRTELNKLQQCIHLKDCVGDTPAILHCIILTYVLSTQLVNIQNTQKHSACKTLFKLFIFEVVFAGDDSSQHKTKSYKIVYVFKIMCKRLHKKQT